MPSQKSNKGSYIFWGIIALILLVGGSLSRMYVDWLWFKSINLGSVFTITLISKLAVGFIGFLLAFLFVWFNLNLTRRNTHSKQNTSHQGDDGVIYLNQEVSSPWQNLLNHPFTKWVFVAVAAMLALLVNGNMSSKWIIVQQYLNQVPFGVKDPIFGHDLAFYFFNLPLFEMIYGYLLGLLLLTIIAVGIVYLITVSVELFFMEWENVTFATKHLGVLIAFVMGIVAIGYRLHAYSILYSPTGVVYGAGYTDIHAKLMGYRILFFIALIVALAILVNLIIRRVRWILYALGAWLVFAIVLNGFIPFVMQKLVVAPNEYNQEKPYIQNAIKFTRQAYNLDKISSRDFNVDYKLTASDLDKNKLTVKNIRLWDWQPLRTTYRQIQEIRPYYLFNDVDVDRYQINGESRQVMLAARELDPSGLPENAKTWVSMRMQYTHGYGLALSPVNEVAQEGLPNLFIKDVPPRFTTDLKVNNPAIYYGEVNNDYVVVKTKTKEFDYPSGSENVYSTYQADSGVRVGSFINRLVFAFVFKDYKMLISNQINADSRVLLNRNIHYMVERIAPFLSYDEDPYLVIADEKMYWMQDAYTVSSRYPYSEPFDERGANYIRNSVKVVIDAYTGQPTFYVADETDPIIKAMGGTFSKLFKPMESMPTALKSHVRYPEDLFKVQTQMLTTFHMLDPQVFYYKEDKWSIPQEIFGDKAATMEPYYTIMKLPDAVKEEYILMRPFTPNTKQNMVAWLAARSDGENYGKLQLYLFPKQELIFGPMQIESRVNQDSEISQALTLWNQKGSSIFRGNLLVIPIENSILYVEPLYLQAAQSQLPELKRIIAVYGDKVVMEPTLDAALKRLFGESEYTPPATETPSLPGAPLPTVTVNSLITQAQQYYTQADAALRAGDFTGYGEAQAKLRATLERLVSLSKQTPVTQ
ncbi:MAG: UPF0182 family protein [Methylocystaceae bacterium]